MNYSFDFGVIGLGVMGAALSQNIINNGICTALYSISEEERKGFYTKEGKYKIFSSLEEFVEQMPRPRRIFLMITAGRPVDLVITQLLPLLAEGDIIMDGGNSYYKDTMDRERRCSEKGIEYMGIGVSGGEAGALRGPSMMAGGSIKAWNEVKDVLTKIAARQGDTCCCGYIGPEGAGHYVKMVHNGIEYAILELIAETYHFLRFTKNKSVQEIKKVFENWNKGVLKSYLLEISTLVLDKKDDDGEPLIDRILDVAGQKGTGKWTIIEAVERGVYIPSIYEAQAVRSFSQKLKERQTGAEQLAFHGNEINDIGEEDLKNALLLAIILCYSQGFELIAKASQEENWGIEPEKLASVWKAGCIIRSDLLEKIEKSGDLEKTPLIFSEEFSFISDMEGPLRRVAEAAISAGAPMSGYLAAIEYYDYYRAQQMPINFIQALRDCFGAHTYKRIDRPGDFHTIWER